MTKEQEEQIKIAKEQGKSLECEECGEELSERTYRTLNGLCMSCVWLLDK